MTGYSSEFHPESESGLVEKFEDMLQTRTSRFFDVEEIEELADYYLEKGNHAKARKVVKHGLGIHPGSPAIMLRKAQAMLMIKEPKRALEILNYLEAAQPMNTEVLLFKAMVHRNLSDHEGTKSCLIKAIDTTPDHKEEIFLDLAFEQEMVEDYDGAIESLIQSLEINPNHEASLFELGYCFDMAQELETGVEFFQKYLEENPYSFVGWYNLALCFEKLSLFEKAIESVDFCIAIKDDFTNAYTLKGNLYTSLDQDVLAISAYAESIPFDEENPVVYVSIGECCERLGRVSEAYVNYKKALELDPNYVDALMGMGALKELEQDFTSSIAFYKEALSHDDTNLDNWHIMAELLIKIGKIDDAEQAYAFMSRTFIHDEESWAALAEIKSSRRQYAEAVEVIEEALSLVSGTNDLQWHLAKHLVKMGKSSRALDVLAEALSKDPSGSKFFLSIFPDAAQIANIAALIDIYAQAPSKDEL
ncbi:MAG: tetratricopeptide repeat protein [Cryomorphaceae bacterium]